MFREARAVWKGGLYAGEGAVTTPSGVLKQLYLCLRLIGRYLAFHFA